MICYKARPDHTPEFADFADSESQNTKATLAVYRWASTPMIVSIG